MKKSLALLSIFCFLFFITSCGGDEPTDEMIEGFEGFVDDANAEETAADTSSTGVYQEEVSDEEVSLQDAMKQNNTEEEVEEGGRSFCECIKENKKLTDLMMETEDDALFDKAMADLEAMKTNDCKILFAGDQSTMEAKRAHERKVKKCLR